MKNQEKELENRIFDILMESEELIKNGDYERGWELIESSISLFPEPKYENDLLYLVVSEMANYALISNNYSIITKYMNILFITGLDRADNGERESLVGKIEYELGHMETAKQLLKVALAKRKAINYFKGKENEKYLKLAKEK